MDMNDKWLRGSGVSESGILRKAKAQHTTVNVEELFVFGYACKIFRDDDKARVIDQGKHLIPWMGDDTLKIDRYDVRATLSDIGQYEAPPGGYSNRMEYLTPAEQKAEQLCEEERYYSLYNNEEQEELNQEEELKRLHKMRASSFGQIPFDYNAKKEDNLIDNPVQNEQKQDEVFIPYANFEIPTGIEIPNTVKQNTFIEKTAKFIAIQGTQMEILIKAKQSNNPQFEFLNQNNLLNKYYKFVLDAVKRGIYPPDESENDSTGTTPINTEQYSDIPLLRSEPISVQTVLPTIKYKPSADCSYTQLISKIKGVPIPSDTIDSTYNSFSISQPFTTESIYYGNTDSNSSQIPENIVGSEPITNSPSISQIDLSNSSKDVEIKQISTGLMLAQAYNSDTSDDENNDEDEQGSALPFSIPSPDLQNIIDKTALYVLKNGKEFENILRTKNDGRFSFLSPTDENHQYYLYKVTGAVCPPVNSVSIRFDSNVPTPTASNNTTPTHSSKLQTKALSSVSFSIKSKEEQPIPLKQVLPQELSSDEEESKEQNTFDYNKVTVQSIKLPTSVDANEPTSMAPSSNHTWEMPKNVEKIVDTVKPVKNEFDISDSSIRDAILESSVFDEERKEAKKAEEKFKDRMAQAAREKLGLITREKQLQLERRKKALAFLNQIKNGNLDSEPLVTVLPNKLPTPPLEPISRTVFISSTLEENNIPIPSIVEENSNNDSKPLCLREDKSDADSSSDSTEINPVERQSRSRSRSSGRSKSSKTKHKKSKHRHLKKKSKKKSSRSRSSSRSRNSRPNKRKKQSSSTSHKSKRKRKSSDRY